MPCEAKELIKVQRKGCFVPYMSKWCETPEIYWGVSPLVVDEAKELAPGWFDDLKLAKLIAEAVPTKEIKKALAELHQEQSTKFPQTAVYLPGKFKIAPPGREPKSVRVTIKVVKNGIEIHPKNIIVA